MQEAELDDTLLEIRNNRPQRVESYASTQFSDSKANILLGSKKDSKPPNPYKQSENFQYRMKKQAKPVK